MDLDSEKPTSQQLINLLTAFAIELCHAQAANAHEAERQLQTLSSGLFNLHQSLPPTKDAALVEALATALVSTEHGYPGFEPDGQGAHALGSLREKPSKQ